MEGERAESREGGAGERELSAHLQPVGFLSAADGRFGAGI